MIDYARTVGNYGRGLTGVDTFSTWQLTVFDSMCDALISALGTDPRSTDYVDRREISFVRTKVSDIFGIDGDHRSPGSRRS